MKFKNNSKLDVIMDALFTPYKKSVTDVEKIVNSLISNQIIKSEEEIVNDHIAFRTLGVPNLGIASIEKLFLHYGYEKKDYYNFEEKKLDAFWYAPPSPKYPRIFISELRVNELPDHAKNIISEYTNAIQQDPVDQINLDDAQVVGGFFYKPLWKLPTISDYKSLEEVSEYAAWVIYNRYYLNHYTISVHELKPPFNSLEKFNTLLNEIGVELNSSGGVIKTSKDGLLKQSSSVAKMVNATFRNGESLKIAGSYVEFAERLPINDAEAKENSDKSTELRDGFESANADKIFESTYKAQTGK